MEPAPAILKTYSVRSTIYRIPSAPVFKHTTTRNGTPNIQTPPCQGRP